MRISDSDIYSPNRKVAAWSSLPDEIIISDLKNDEVFGLQEVSKFIWECIEKEFTFGGILNSLCDSYEVGIEVARNDVAEFIIYLINLGFIRKKS